MPILALSILILLSSYVHALSFEQIDQEFIQHNEYIEESFSRDVNDYRLLLSVPKRINNEISIESEQLLKGKLAVQLVNLSSSKSLKSYASLLESRLNAQGEVLFKCVERSCGVSSIWANDIFAERRLSGRDSDQFYLAGKIQHEDGVYWVSAYLVTNALRKNLMLISFVKETASSPQWSNGFDYDPNKPLHSEIQSKIQGKLATDPDLVLYVAAFTKSQESSSVSASIKLIDAQLKIAQSKLKETLKINDERIKGFKVAGFHEKTANEQAVWFKLYLFRP